MLGTFHIEVCAAKLVKECKKQTILTEKVIETGYFSFF